MRPVPRVRVMNSLWKPIRPRAGMRYSRRTRPVPSGSMSMQLAAARAERFHHAALVLLLDVDGEQLERLAASRRRSRLMHDARPRHRELVAFAAHVLDAGS